MSQEKSVLATSSYTTAQGERPPSDFPQAEAVSSWRRCPRTKEAARPAEKIPRRLGKPVEGGTDTPVRAISSCNLNLEMKSPPFYARAWRDSEKLRAPLPSKHRFHNNKAPDPVRAAVAAVAESGVACCPASARVASTITVAKIAMVIVAGSRSASSSAYKFRPSAPTVLRSSPEKKC